MSLKIMRAHYLQRVPFEGLGSIKETLNNSREPLRVMDWYGRLAEGASYGEHVMVPFEELRGRLDF